MVLYGHTPTPEPEWVNNTMCLDTGLRVRRPADRAALPGEGVVSVPAERVWYEPAKPFLPAARSQARRTPRASPTCSTSPTCSGKRVVETRAPRARHRARGERRRRARGDEPVRARPALAALPAADDGPCATSHAARTCSSTPPEAFAAFRVDGVDRGDLRGEAHGLARGRARVPRRRRRPGPVRRPGRYDRRGLHAHRPLVLRSGTDRTAARSAPRRPDRSRAVGRAGRGLAAARLRAAAVVGEGRGPAAQPVRRRRRRCAMPRCLPPSPRSAAAAAFGARRRRPARPHHAPALANAEAFTAAYRRYCWPTDGLEGVRLAPFQLLATDGATYHDQRPRLAPRHRRPAGRRGSRPGAPHAAARSSTPPTPSRSRQASAGGRS